MDGIGPEEGSCYAVAIGVFAECERPFPETGFVDAGFLAVGDWTV